jgi:hypothetical protein
MKKTTNEGSGAMKFWVIGASLAGLAAAYFFLSPKGKKNLEDAKSWAIKMKGDVIEKLEQASEVSEDIYNKIIDSVADEYEKKSKSSAEEVKSLAEDLKKHWPAISASVKDKKSSNSEKASNVAKKEKS